MNNDVKKRVKEALCPEGIWKFSDSMLTIFNRALRRFPSSDVTEEEERYPTTKSGMKAFLDKFFARHYFQIQDSLLDYMTSESFLRTISDGFLNILDIGAGPAVASLAIADMIGCITDILSNSQRNNSKVYCNFTLNDTSSICLGLGKEMLFDYFRKTKDLHNTSLDKAFFLNGQFPKTFVQLKRIVKNLRPFDIIVFSYVIVPLNEQEIDVNSEIMELKEICGKNGQILIVQDKYNEELMNQIGNGAEKRNITQTVYSNQNGNDSYSYEYYRCLVPGGNDN